MCSEDRRPGIVLHVVDTDASVREGLGRVATAAGFRVKLYASVGRFVTQMRSGDRGCVVLDSSLLGGDTQFVHMMRSRGVDWPVIVLRDAMDDSALHGAKRFGANFMLSKPVDSQALFDAIAWVTDGRP